MKKNKKKIKKIPFSFFLFPFWQSLELYPMLIDVHGLLRPIVISLATVLFPNLVLGVICGVLSPIVQGTHKILDNQTMEFLPRAEG